MPSSTAVIAIAPPGYRTFNTPMDLADAYLHGNDQLLYLGCPLDGSTQTGIAEVALDGRIGGETVATVYLHGLAGDALGRLTGEELGHGGLLPATLTSIIEPGSVIHQPAGGFYVQGHSGKLEGDALELAYGLAELFPVLGIFQGCL